MPEPISDPIPEDLYQRLRHDALEIYRLGLAQITPEFLLRQAMTLESGNRKAGDVGDASLALTFLDRRERVVIPAGGRLWLVAIGKAACPMAEEAARLLGDGVAGGVVVTKEGFALPGLPWPVHETGHPVPDERGVVAAAAVETLMEGTAPEDVVLVLMSGGASALLPAPVAGLTLEDKQGLVDVMLRTNMDIHEMNTVRKAVSSIKGGGLAALAAPARTVGLYLSDVPGDHLASIGSGPTVPERSDFAAVRTLLQDKGIWEAVPAAVREVLERGKAPDKTPPTPPVNGLIGANRHLLRAMAEAAEGLGYAVRSDEEPTTGLNPDALPGLLARWNQWREETPEGRPVVFISGGETTVVVTGSGKGGRCQELAALALPRMPEKSCFLAAGSDGNDGPTDAAGGLADAPGWRHIREEGILYDELLADNDSYALLERSGNLVKVPPTRNNVMDVHLFLSH